MQNKPTILQSINLNNFELTIYCCGFDVLVLDYMLLTYGKYFASYVLSIRHFVFPIESDNKKDFKKS